MTRTNVDGAREFSPEELPTKATALQDAALAYARLGLHVFPTDAKTKRPRIKNWTQLATTDERQIGDWWDTTPQAGIGVVCSRQSGIAVIDVDVKQSDPKGLTGADHWARLLKDNGGIGSNAVVCDTPSGGIHLFCRWDSLPFEKSEGRVGYGIDVRSTRPDDSGAGYVQVAPTKGTGGQYVWRRKKLPTSVDSFPEAPEWLALLACFRPAERAVIERAPGLHELITSQPRIRWRAVFETHQQTAKRQDKILKHLAKTLMGAPPTIDHPWARSALTGVVDDVENADGVARPQNAQLYVSSARSGNILAALECEEDGEEAEQQKAALFNAIMSAPDLDASNPWDSPDGRKKAHDTIASGMRKGFAHPLDLPELSPASSHAIGKPDRKASNEKTSRQAVSGSRVANITCLSDVTSKPIEWLWKGWIVKGGLTVIVGDPGVGKSQCTSDIAARASLGKQFCDEENPPKREPVNVILLNAEDATESVIAPRLKAAGADPKYVHILNGVKRVKENGDTAEVEFSLTEDAATLATLIEQIGNVGLVVIDPVSAYLGKVDSHNNSEVRSVLAPLSRLAEKHNVAIVCVSHLNKGGDAKALYRISGSLAFGAAARSVIVVGPNPEDATGKEKVFCSAKSNLAKGQSALTFTIKDVLLPLENVETSRVEWQEIDPDLTAKAVLSGGAGSKDRPSARDECAEWLVGLLSGKRITGREVKSEAENLGFSYATLRRAANAVGVKMVPGCFQGDFVWSLGPHKPRPSQRAA